MKIGEVWKYKPWLIKLLNDNVHLYAGGYSPSTDSVRIRIVEIDGEDIWFMVSQIRTRTDTQSTEPPLYEFLKKITETRE